MMDFSRRALMQTVAATVAISAAPLPALFLMHFRGTMDSWDPAVVDPLAKHRPVILFSNAGIGLSGGEVPKSIEAMAGHVEAFLDAFEIEDGRSAWLLNRWLYCAAGCT